MPDIRIISPVGPLRATNQAVRPDELNVNGIGIDSTGVPYLSLTGQVAAGDAARIHLDPSTGRVTAVRSTH